MASATDAALARFLLSLSHTGSRIIPLRLAQTASLPVADAISAFLERHRTTAEQNFARVLGRSADDPLVGATARDSFRHFGRYVVESIHVQGWGTSDVVDRLDVEGEEHFAEAQGHGRGVIFVSGHMGSTEVAAAMAVLHGFKITSVTEPVRPAWLMEYLVRSRRRMGIELLPTGGSGISLLRTLRRGGMAAFVVDAGLDRAGAVAADFFGAPARFPDGPARLARLSGAPLVFGTAVRLPGGRYRAYVGPPILSDREADMETDVAHLTQRLASSLEDIVRRYPSQWYAFRPMWND